MPDLRGIRRNGPGPQSFTRGQHQQQKPIGSCLTFKQYRCTSSEPQQYFRQQPLDGNASGEPQHFQQQPLDGNASGEPQHFRQQPLDGNASGEPQQHCYRQVKLGCSSQQQHQQDGSLDHALDQPFKQRYRLTPWQWSHNPWRQHREERYRNGHSNSPWRQYWHARDSEQLNDFERPRHHYH